MRRLTALALVVAFAVIASPAPMVLAQAQTGGVAGTAADPSKNPLANHTVRLRNVSTGQISASTTSAANGTFSFAGITPGSYVVEIVNAAGNIVGTSSAVAVTAGAVATVTVTATAIAAGAAAAGAAGAGLFGLGAAGTVIAAAVVAGIVVAVVATQDDASPSR